MNTIKKTVENNFKWDDLVSQISVSFRLTEKETENLFSSKIARLIGALPFLASVNNPQRTSLTNLSTYMIASRGSKEVFYHNILDDDNVLSRLDAINNFNGGDKKIIEKGMKLLALNMVHDYLRDRDEDRENSKYNPLNSGAWDYKQIISRLNKDISSIESKELDDYFSSADAAFAFWFVI